MNTPVCDFVRAYAAEAPIRMHMPGHKGKKVLGPEELDITEISGADVLYDAEGILRESEENAARLFGSARTLYSTEGSSLCIRAMLFLAQLHAAQRGRKLSIAAGRNAHRTFLDAAAVLDAEVTWLGSGEELLRGTVTPEALDTLLSESETAPTAVYVTSPDYLGHCTPLREISELCRRHGILFLVDNAHGAYLKFLSESGHPLDRGADLCCDSAHKTLPVLTGGAYLHASEHCPKELLPMMERAMAFFASTSPSWLVLQSLDAVNARLAADYPEQIRQTAASLGTVKAQLEQAGWETAGTEALKLTLSPKPMGYTGTGLSDLLRERGIVVEFADPDYLVAMATPETGEADLAAFRDALLALPHRKAVIDRPPPMGRTVPVMRLREAVFSPFERVPVEESLGRILASPSVSCPPAVPILVCGDRIDERALRLFQYYGIRHCDVVKP